MGERGRFLAFREGATVEVFVKPGSPTTARLAFARETLGMLALPLLPKNESPRGKLAKDSNTPASSRVRRPPTPEPLIERWEGADASRMRLSPAMKLLLVRGQSMATEPHAESERGLG